MPANKFYLLLFFLLARSTVFADIALQKPEKLQPTKYYFANVDSFQAYRFFVKKSVNFKTYRIKQDAAFLLQPKSKTGDERLEVWAERKSDQTKSNSFILTTVEPAAIYGGDIAYIAITFSIDKNNKLSYKRTVMKPDCYGKKEWVPILVFNFPENQKPLLLTSILSMLVLMSLFFISRMKKGNAYI